MNNRAPTASAALSDPRAVAMGRVVALAFSAHPLANKVEVDLMLVTLTILEREGLVFSECLRQCPKEQARLTVLALDLGLVLKVGRGRKTRYVLGEGPSLDVVGEVLRAEFKAAFRVEGMVRELSRNSSALALLGLEDERAALYLRRMCAAEGLGWVLEHLAGSERIRDAKRT